MVTLVVLQGGRQGSPEGDGNFLVGLCSQTVLRSLPTSYSHHKYHISPVASSYKCHFNSVTPRVPYLQAQLSDLAVISRNFKPI